MVYLNQEHCLRMEQRVKCCCSPLLVSSVVRRVPSFLCKQFWGTMQPQRNEFLKKKIVKWGGEVPGNRFKIVRVPEGRHIMGSSYISNHIHVVFSTKKRVRSIKEEMQPKLWAYMAGIAKNHGMHAVKFGGIEDHVHLLINLGGALGIVKALQ